MVFLPPADSGCGPRRLDVRDIIVLHAIHLLDGTPYYLFCKS
jgi:hypothetical protein